MVRGDGITGYRVGEVIEATSSSFVAQCYQLYDAPPIGSLVQAGRPAIYGVVCQVRTEPLDPGRPVLARGYEAESEEQVYQENPQISRLLASRFEVAIMGHQGGETCYQHLPPLPPRVHSFVYTCDTDQIAQFTDNLDFLHLLVHGPGPVSDEVIGACLQQASLAHSRGPEFLVDAGRFLATELSSDLPRLSAILRRITSWPTSPH